MFAGIDLWINTVNHDSGELDQPQPPTVDCHHWQAQRRGRRQGCLSKIAIIPMRLILTIIMIIPSHRHHLQGEKTFGIHCERGWGPAECVVAHLEQTVKIVMMVHDYRSYQRWPFQDSGSSLGQLQWWWVGAQLHPPQPGRQGGEEQRGAIPQFIINYLTKTLSPPPPPTPQQPPLPHLLSFAS